MSLFKQLEKLYPRNGFPREDFHTEIVAQVLRNSRELTLEWLRSLKVTELKEDVHIEIISQPKFGKLAEHPTDSRPDMAISLYEGGNKELIFIESKVGSKQGDTQLQRYSAILADEKTRNGFTKTSLIFITRDYEATAIDDVSSPDFNFRPTRWFEFYKHLKAHVNGDGLAKELMLFMEEKRMSLGNQFRSTHLVAMENFLSAKALMDQTPRGTVSIKTHEIFGYTSNTKKALPNLRDSHRFGFSVKFNGFQFLIGYCLPQENPDEAVWVGVELLVGPGVPIRKELIRAFKGRMKKSGGSWTGDQLDDETEWCDISKGKDIQSFMAEEDHVQAIKDHFLQLLEEVGEFKKTHPNLPWKSSVPVVETGE